MTKWLGIVGGSTYTGLFATDDQSASQPSSTAWSWAPWGTQPLFRGLTIMVLVVMGHPLWWEDWSVIRQ